MIEIPSTQWARFNLHKNTLSDLEQLARTNSKQIEKIIERRCADELEEGKFEVREVILIGDAIEKAPGLTKQFSDSIHDRDKDNDIKKELSRGYVACEAIKEIYDDVEEF